MPMNLPFVRRLASLFAMLVLLVGQAWAGPTARLPARPCCCKAAETARSSVGKAKCCGQAEHGRAATQVAVRIPAPSDPLLLAVLPSSFIEAEPLCASIDNAPYPARPPDHGIGTGLPYRMRV